MSTKLQLIRSSLLATLLLLSSLCLQAQVTIGSGKIPEAFSILEIVSGGEGGLRLPQLTTAERDGLTFSGDVAKGLTIYNMSTDCLDYWNGTKWISLCQGQASITFKDGGGSDAGDITEPEFPAGGGEKGPFTPVDNPNCTESNPAYAFLVITGSEYTNIEIIDESTGQFKISMDENNTAIERRSIVRIVNNCTQEYKEFVFSQAGDNTGCGTSPSVPAILSVTATNELCQNGSLYLYLTGYPTTGTYIWTLNGEQVGEGHSCVVDKLGTYIVYGDKIGCSNSQSYRVITAGGTTAPAAVSVIAVGNNGVACGAGAVVDLIVSTPSSGTVVWYKDGIKTAKTGTTIQADKGSWFAVVEDGGCSSQATRTIEVTENTISTPLPAPVMKVNGVTSGYSLCNGGSMYLEVDAPAAGISYTWYLGDTQIGTGNSVYRAVPATNPIVIRLRATGVGCAGEQIISESLNATSAPAAPSITVNTPGNALCGGEATLTASTSGTSYRWFKDGVEIAGKTTQSIVVEETGSYTVSASNGACTSILSGARTIISSNNATLSWGTSHPTTANVGEVKTYNVVLDFPEGATYQWTVSGTGAAIVTGGETSSVNVRFSTGGVTATVTCTATNACGSIAPLSQSVSVASATVPPSISGTSSLTPNVNIDQTTTLSVTATGTGPLSYQWYTGTSPSGTAIPSATSASYVYTGTAPASNKDFYCVVTGPGGSSTAATSPKFTVTVNANPALITPGSGAFSGKTCFDLAKGNDNANSCAPLSVRTNQRTNFDVASPTAQDPAVNPAAPYSRSQVYTFRAAGNVSNVRFLYDDPNGVIESVTANGTYTGNYASGNECKVTVVYKRDLNTRLAGLTRAQALKATLYAVYNTQHNSGGTDAQLNLTASFQDCACCGAPTVGGGWLTFMCHNLGADESLDPFSPSEALYGDLYQWGRKKDGHEKRNSQNNSNRINGLTGTSDRFITHSSTPYDWANPQNTTLWLENAKGPNDPCPAGWRVPTQAEWASIFRGGTTSGAPNTSGAGAWTSKGTWSAAGAGGFMVGDALFLPAAGCRHRRNAALNNVGTRGYYWSSTVNSTGSYNLYFTSTNVNPAYTNARAYGLSVRCVAE